MPDVRPDSRGCLRWRLPALLTGVTLVSGVVVVRSTIERLHHRIREERRLRARLPERRAVEAHERGGPEPNAPASCVVDEPRTETVAIPATVAGMDAPPAVARPASAVGRPETTSQVAETAFMPTSWPVPGVVSSPFGWRESPYGGDDEWHPGIDIVAPRGTPVRATADGEVSFAGYERGYGALVVVDHGAASTRYAHLSAIWVRVGSRVRRGDPLGALGGTGRATAPHLHYEVRLGREPLDPACFLTTPSRGRRRSHSCGLVRARLEGHGVAPATRMGVTTSRAATAG